MGTHPELEDYKVSLAARRQVEEYSYKIPFSLK